MGAINLFLSPMLPKRIIGGTKKKPQLRLLRDL
jgi:hypothetical protein